MPGAGRWRTAAAIAVALGTALALGGAAGARASCAPISAQQQFRSADVVLDGVVLSGPRAEGDIASPARVRVTRYLKGSGPKVVLVGTNVPQVRSGDFPALIGILAEDVRFAPGMAFRIYGRTPRGAGASAASGILAPQPCAGLGRPPAASRPVPVPKSGVGASLPGEPRGWRARVLRGPGRLYCVVYRWRRPIRDGECGSLRGPRTLLLGVRSTRRRGGRATTAIVAAGPGLRRIDVAHGGATFAARARGSGRIALLAFDGVIDPDALAVRAFFRGGGERLVDRTERRALAADPEGRAPWEAVAERAHPHRRGLVCVRWHPTDSYFAPPVPWVVPGECGDVAPGRFFFAVRALRRYDDGSHLVYDARRVVFGAVSDEVERVIVTGPGGPRQLEPARRGHAFIAVYPGAVTAADLTVSVELNDGTREVYSGLSELGVRRAKIPLGGGDPF